MSEEPGRHATEKRHPELLRGISMSFDSMQHRGSALHFACRLFHIFSVILGFLDVRHGAMQQMPRYH
jgi:hypothetical protein